MGLDDSIYGTVRSHILSTDPLPTLNQAYAIIAQERCVRNMTREKEQRSEAMSFAVNSRGKMENKEKKDEVCSYWKWTGHSVEGCIELIGYPDWWGDRPKGNKRGT